MDPFLALLSAILLSVFRGYPVSGRAIPDNWYSLISADVVSATVGRDPRDRFDPDVFEGDLMGFETDEPPSVLRAKTVTTIFTPDSSSRWSNGIIPYTINGTTSKLRNSDRRFIENALQQIQQALGGSCIQFVPRKTEVDFINFIKGFACFSNVGRQGGKQLISVTQDCLQEPGAIQHLVLHALGLFHENARVVRNTFVTINRDNVLPDAINYFNAYVDYGPSAGPYDVESLTHYPFTVFAMNQSGPTILPKKTNSRMGQLDGLSSLDIAKIQTAYGCHQLESSTADPSNPKLLDITPDPPDQPATPASTSQVDRKQLLKHAQFQIRDIDRRQCSSVNTANCRVMPGSKNCKRGFGLITQCEAAADNLEVGQFLTNIGRLNASRGMEFTIKGRRTFSNDDFAPAADVIIILIIADFDGLAMSMLRSLNLPAITHIGLSNCRNVVIGQDDFLFFPRLTMLVLYNSTVARIEQGAYESLPLLQQVAFDGGIPLDGTMTVEQRDYLWLLHCDCQYKWLRKFLDKNRNLITAKQAGEVHAFGGIMSHSATIRQMYAPVDCARKDLIGELTQIPFTVNDPCS
ncbi:hypothetical protein RvY_16179 [Ramazzottius varieornatus]|uniref:Metalloendopeptidase n=1 Tax=Ramazzottius varieornatus TaxID=947166 RepID=A0A1D1W204_RAMVA|nr:hypothetical protein RvY_16179 [Ramazzottius varieornatus]